MEKTSATAVLDRIAQAVGAKDDSEAAKALKIARSTWGNWRARESIPYPLCVKLAEERGIRLDWLLIGEGPALREDAPQACTLPIKGRDAPMSPAQKLLMLAIEGLKEEEQCRIAEEAYRARGAIEMQRRLQEIKAEEAKTEKQATAAENISTAITQTFNGPASGIAGRDIRNYGGRQ